MPVKYTTNNAIATFDGVRLFGHAWTPEAPPRSVLILVHGVVEHAGRYAEFGESLAEQGIAVRAPDLRGHGRSDGPRGDVPSFERYVSDLDLFLRTAEEEFPTAPKFLLGHSMGGTIVLRWAIEQRLDVDGIILNAPAIVVGEGVAPWLRYLAPLANRLLPALRVKRLGSGGLSRDPSVRDAYLADPLIYHGRLTVRLSQAILQAAADVRARLDQVETPFLVLHGDEDPVTDPNGSRELLARAASLDKRMIAYPGLLHDLLHEPERGTVTGDVVRWIEERTNSALKSEKP